MTTTSMLSLEDDMARRDTANVENLCPPKVFQTAFTGLATLSQCTDRVQHAHAPIGKPPVANHHNMLVRSKLTSDCFHTKGAGSIVAK